MRETHLGLASVLPAGRNTSEQNNSSEVLALNASPNVSGVVDFLVVIQEVLKGRIHIRTVHFRLESLSLLPCSGDTVLDFLLCW